MEERRIVEQRLQPTSNLASQDTTLINKDHPHDRLRSAGSSSQPLVPVATASIHTVSSTAAPSVSSSNQLFPSLDPQGGRRASYKLWNPSNTSFKGVNPSVEIPRTSSQFTVSLSSRRTSAALEPSPSTSDPSPISLLTASTDQSPVSPTVNIASQTGKRRRGQGMDGEGGSRELHPDPVTYAPPVIPVAAATKRDESVSDTSLPLQRPSPMEQLARDDNSPSPNLPLQGALTADKDRDLELGTQRFEPPATRAPFPPAPLGQRPETAETSDPAKPDAAANDAAPEELAWGPSHPCFPHPNPHVPLSSPLYGSTRIIRIRRDWLYTGDLAPTFSNIYPQILDPLLSENEFRGIIKKVNDGLIEAFDPFAFRNWVDNILGILTGWLWEDAGLTAVKSRLKRIEAWLERWNQEVGAREGVKVVPLRRTAYMTLDIQIPVPVLAEDEESVGAEAGTRDNAQNPV